MHHAVSDRNGRHYDAFIQQSGLVIEIKLYDRTLLVGTVKCASESAETLFLKDIAIANRATPTVDPRDRQLAKLFGRSVKAAPTNYRGQGLGSALLTVLVAHAHTNGFRYLYGDVFQQDIENTPNLLRWYERHGFEIRPLHSIDKPDVVALVHLDIDRWIAQQD